MHGMVAFVEITEAYAKSPPRARGQDRRHTSGDSLRGQPNESIEPRTTSYTGHARLGSCAKDPIGYEDGWNLYRAYFILQATDPTGTTLFNDTKCGSAPSSADKSLCNVHKGTKYYGFDASCVCKCAGNSPWDKQVRGCLHCAQQAGVDSDEAHNRCYELADKEHGSFEGGIRRLIIATGCSFCNKDCWIITGRHAPASLM